MLLHGVLHLFAQMAHTPAESQHADAAAGVIPICCLHLEGGPYAEAVLLKIGQCCMPAGRLHDQLQQGRCKLVVQRTVWQRTQDKSSMHLQLLQV